MSNVLSEWQPFCRSNEAPQSKLMWWLHWKKLLYWCLIFSVWYFYCIPLKVYSTTLHRVIIQNILHRNVLGTVKHHFFCHWSKFRDTHVRTGNNLSWQPEQLKLLMGDRFAGNIIWLGVMRSWERWEWVFL